MAVKQSIPSYTNTNKSLTLGNFKGIDASSSPFEVDISRATYCQNLINENGVNHKRQGWTQDNELNDLILSLHLEDVYGIFANLKIDSYEDLKVILGKKGSSTKIFVIKTNLECAEFSWNGKANVKPNNKVNCLMNNGKVYLFLNNSINIITSLSSSGIKQLTDIAYIPTTAISINSIDETEHTASVYEESNLFTMKRKNTLIGKSSNIKTLNFILDYSNDSNNKGDCNIVFILTKKSTDGVTINVPVILNYANPKGFVLDNNFGEKVLRILDGEYLLQMYVYYSETGEVLTTFTPKEYELFDEEGNKIERIVVEQDSVIEGGEIIEIPYLYELNVDSSKSFTIKVSGDSDSAVTIR